MASCHWAWAQPAQLHPWFKPATLKRKRSAMFQRLESPSPVDGDDFDSRVKRHRRITLDQTTSKKRKLPSPPQSPIEESGDPPLFKRQRCTTLERSIERLSLTPLAHEPAAHLPAPFSAGPVLRAPGYPFFPQWLEMDSPALRNPPACTPKPALMANVEPVTDVKMRTSSWYEPEKDRIIITDLDVSSDDEVDIADDAPKLPRSVLQALLRGPECDHPRLLELPLVPPQQLSQSLDPPLSPDYDLAGLSGPQLDEVMDVEQ